MVQQAIKCYHLKTFPTLSDCINQFSGYVSSDVACSWIPGTFACSSLIFTINLLSSRCDKGICRGRVCGGSLCRFRSRWQDARHHRWTSITLSLMDYFTDPVWTSGP
ncbi:hypothetical protein RvY_17531 [Ramazzottius varieornatus]|uniref:Uncharacterized protein n=1 Tax=Ramazzottius varieornatus TaxID=947166 RepID=A0A1D1W893_RAMVA|nr:hypothetical protein RvY_17531 [Ramazzottius varieornatus]